MRRANKKGGIMRKRNIKWIFRRITAISAAALMAIEMVPMSSLTAYAATDNSQINMTAATPTDTVGSNTDVVTMSEDDSNGKETADVSNTVSGITDEATAAGFAKMDVSVTSDDKAFDTATTTVTMSDSGEEYLKAIQALRDAGIAVDYRSTYMFSISSQSGDKALDMSKAKASVDAEWGLIPTNGEFMEENCKYSVYIYDGKSVREQTEGVSVEDYYGMPYYSGYDKFTINGNEKILFINELNVHEALEPGVYSIDANLTVLGKNNAVLSGVQVYLTNTDLPPVEIVKQNGVLTVNNDGSMELSIENFSAIFTLQQLEDGSDVHITGRTMDKTGLESPQPTTRINGLKIKLDNYNGFYSFTNAKQYPVILMDYTQMPVDLIVDFDSAELIYKPEAGKTEYTKTLTDEETGITATVRTTDEEQGKKLDGASFKATKIAGNEYDDMYYRMYRYRYSDEYYYYNFALTAADGTSLATGDNENMLVNISNIPVGEVSYPAATIISDELTDHSVSFADGKAVINLNGLNKIAFYDKYSSYDIYHSDSTATDGSNFKLTRYATTSHHVSNAGEARSEKADNGVKYFAKLASTSQMVGSTRKCDERLEISIPSSDVKQHMYLVITDGDNTYVREYKDIEKWTKDDRTYLNLFDKSGKYDEGSYIDADKNEVVRFYDKEVYGGEIFSSRFYGIILKALNNGYNNVTPDEKHPVAYVLNTDNAYASMPAIKGEYNTTLSYSGKEQPNQKWMFGDNSSVTGTLNATNAGTYTFTVTPDAGYTWIDGTNDTKTYSWEIRKATLAAKLNIDKRVVSVDEKIPDVSLNVVQFVNGETEETAAGYVAPTISGIPESLEKGQVYTIKAEGGSADNYVFAYYEEKLTVLKDGQICVKTPEYEQPVYDGKPHTASSTMTEDDNSKQYYTFENADFEMTYPTDSSYNNPIKLALKDKENCIWDDGTTADKKISWKIRKAELVISYVSETIEEGQTPALELKYEGFVEGDNFDNQKSFNTNIKVTAPEVLEGGKTYELIPKGDEYLNNYNITYKSGTLTVLKKQEETPDDDDKSDEYTVTANLSVPGELNTQLPGVTAYMTNPDNPLGIVPDGYDSVNSVAPTTPVSNNAKLKDNKDGTYTLTLNVPNPVFTLQKIGNSTNAEIVSSVRDNKTYSGNTGVSRNGRITQLTIKLKDKSGTYIFNDCTEFPTLLETDWNVPLTLSVEFPADDNKNDDNKDNNDKEQVDTSNITVVSDVEKTTADTPVISVKGISTSAKEYFKSLITKDDIAKLAEAGNKLELKLTAENVTNTISEADKKLIADKVTADTTLSGAVVGQYVDINAELSALNKKITEIPNSGTITLSVKLDNSLINKAADRTYYVVRLHKNSDGSKTAQVINTTFDSVTGSIKFDTDRFSTYAIVYKDAKTSDDIKVPDNNGSDDANKDSSVDNGSTDNGNVDNGSADNNTAVTPDTDSTVSDVNSDTTIDTVSEAVSAESVATADTSNMYVYILIMMAAVASALAVVSRKKAK